MADFDWDKLDRELDKIKSKIFIGRQSAFFAPLMSSMRFIWSTGIETAATDGTCIWWNPEWFLEAPAKYGEPRFNETVLRHELWHPAKLHLLRQGDREGDLWNYACDVRINNDLHYEGYRFGSFKAWINLEVDKIGPERMVEEDIYDYLLGRHFEVPESPWGSGEFVMPGGVISNDNKRRTINNVVRAKTSCEWEGKEDQIPGNTQALLDHFLAPRIPWEQVLLKWHQDLGATRTTWKRPRRRTAPLGIYLPSRTPDDDRLAHLMYFQDVSGSVTEQESLVFNSELKYVWDYMKPKKMTVVQFDTIIQKVDVYETGDDFVRVEILGRGGNDMDCVRRMINEEKPTAAVIFTDLMYEPMEPLDVQIPLLWIVNHETLEPPFGDMIRIKVTQDRPRFK